MVHTSARFSRLCVPATPEHAARLRLALAGWLGSHLCLDQARSSDVLLAINEALANAVEYAYRGVTQPGSMHILAAHDQQSSTLTVTVIDEGSWCAGDGDDPHPARGRGIALMYALADRAVIEVTATGTRVRLQWQHIQLPGPLSQLGRLLDDDGLSLQA